MRLPQRLRDELYERAILANVRGPAGIFAQRYVQPSPHYGAISGQWLWDAAYVAWAVAKSGGDVQLGREIVLSAMAAQVDSGPDAGMLLHAPNEQGAQPERIVGTSQTPMIAWVAAAMHQLDPDPAYLEAVYPGLSAHVRWWRSPRRDVDGDGLSEYAGPNFRAALHESGLDVSPVRERLLHDAPEPSTDGLVHDLVADAGLNSFVHAEAKALAAIARVVAPTEVDDWEAAADEISAAMRRHMWSDEVGAFMPVLRADLDPERRQLCHVTAHVLLPLWAGVATADQAARTIDLVRNRWLDWPTVEGRMRVDVAVPAAHPFSWQVTSTGLTPPPDRSWAAVPDGVTVTGLGRTGAAGRSLLDIDWPEDRQAAAAWFARIAVSVDADGPVEVTVTDSRGICHVEAAKDGSVVVIGAVSGPPPPDAPLLGLARLEVTAAADNSVLRSVTVEYARPRPEGLLSRYGVRSTHPLDGKVPVRGAPTHYWSGTVWAPYTWHAVEALRANGEDELAALVAEGYCSGVRQSYAFGMLAPEHHCEHTGIGMGCDRQAWTAGVALLLDDLLREDDAAARAVTIPRSG
jgi:hypothetical protein